MSTAGEPCEGGDPSVVFSVRDKAFYLGQLCFQRTAPDSEIFVYKSTDSGASWSAPSVVVTNRSGSTVDGSVFYDKDMLAVDNTPTSPHRQARCPRSRVLPVDDRLGCGRRRTRRAYWWGGLCLPGGWFEVEVGGATNASTAQAAHEVGDRGADLVWAVLLDEVDAADGDLGLVGPAAHQLSRAAAREDRARLGVDE